MAIDQMQAVINDAYIKGSVSRRRVQIEVDKFRDFCYIAIKIGDKLTIRRFHEGQEVESRWMIQHDRLPWIAKMLKEGYTQRRIAEMLCFSVGTINKDVRYMRENKPNMINMPHTIPGWRTTLGMRHYRVVDGATVH